MALFLLRGVSVQDVIHDQDLELRQGETTFVTGESGCGKSTLLRLLNASLSAQEGKIFYQNKPLDSYDTIALRREVMLVSQSVFLFDDTVLGNVQTFYGYREQPPPPQDTIREYLALCAMPCDLNSSCKWMSGGERQRIFLSICLSFSPKVLLLDEPTSALDEHTAHQVMGQLKRHCEERDITLVVVTHDKALAMAYAQRIIKLGEEG